jgi:sugar transferase EpsL
VKHCYQGFPKRVIDVTLATSALAVFLPLCALIALAVYGYLGMPVLFRQSRPGLRGSLFELLKFRTMTDARDDTGALMADATRMTRFGRFLRSTSLDELPELWNVIRGEMSLVGPRPLLTRYLERYTPEQARRHEVRPGITGWAQVNGRNTITWEEKFDLDVWYVDKCSFALDMKILALTAWQVLARRGINQPGHATAQEFMGTPTR